MQSYARKIQLRTRMHATPGRTDHQEADAMTQPSTAITTPPAQPGAQAQDPGQPTAPAQVWVSVTSHRSRERLQRAVPDLGRSYGIADPWPPRGEYYQI